MNPVAPADSALLKKYGGAAPRYTSYPTAVQFTSAFGAAEHGRALAALDARKPVSLYAHIPFCHRLCWYCGCNTRAVRRHEAIDKYIDLLCDELSLVAQRLPGRLTAGSVHLGGGTPNMLSADNLAKLFASFNRHFDLAPHAAISAELDPMVLTRDWVRAAASRGLNRASLGVQDLSPEVQTAVNRIEGFDVIQRAVGWLREANVRSINFDLMYGLPKQTAAHVLSTLDRVLTLRPDRLALFGYAHVSWMKPHQRLLKEADLPGAEARMEQSQRAAERLLREGYVAVGMDHFALPDDSLAIAQAQAQLRRNFQGYTDDTAGALIGVGVSAISLLPGGIAQNLSVETQWREAVAHAQLPVARGVAVSAEDRLRGAIIEQLMCAYEADIPAIRARLGDSDTRLDGCIAALVPLVDDGVVTFDGARVCVTGQGRPYLRAACLAFDAYFEPAAQRHSRTV